MLEPGRFTSSRFGGRSGGIDPLPRLTVEISPTSITEGDEVTLTFNEEPDTVDVLLNGAVLTVSGAGLVRTVTPEEPGSLNIQAEKADYRGVNVTRTVAELVVVPTITLETSPDPIVANEPFELTFTPPVDSADSSVPLTGAGATWTGVAPASGPMAITAEKEGYQLFEVSRTVDTAVITPTAPITPVAMYETQTIADIPSIATKSSISGYTRTGRTIASVNLLVGRYSGGVDQEQTLGGFEAATTATALDDGDVAVARVTDSGGTVKDFILGVTEYAENIILNPDGSLTLDINTIIPAGEKIPVSALGVTTNISRNDMADGEELFIAPTMAGAAAGATWTIKRATWAVDADLPMPTIVRTMREDGVVVHTFALEDFDPDTFEASWVSPSGGAGKSYVYHEDCGGSTAQTSPIAIPAAGVTMTNLARLQDVKASDSTAAHAMGNVTVPASGTGRVVVRGVIFSALTNSPEASSITIGGVTVPIHSQQFDSWASVFVASIPRSSLPAGSQAVVVNNIDFVQASRSGNSLACVVSVDYLADAAAPGTATKFGSSNSAPTTINVNVNTTANGIALGVIAEGQANSRTASTLTWSGLTEEHRAPIASGTWAFTGEFASHAPTTAETPRAISLTGLNSSAGFTRQTAISIFFGKAA